MKKLCFVKTNRCHARNKLLLDKLREKAEVVVADTEIGEGDMGQVASAMSGAFYKFLEKTKPNGVIIRGDRAEMLSPAMISAYMGIPIFHIEGFDLSGVIDNKVRYAISYLSDYHFVTNNESYVRALAMGFENVWNFGALDCEYAIAQKALKSPRSKYVVVLYHPIPNEPYEAVLEATERLKSEYEVLGVRSNADYGVSTYTEEYAPDEFIRLIRDAECLIGNSSAGLKEASVLGTPVVNIGERQKKRLKPRNVIDAQVDDIEKAVKYQIKHGRYPVDPIYYQEGTSQKTAETILNL